MSIATEAVLMRLVGSDFLFWAAMHLAPNQVTKMVLATPPEQVSAASPNEQARVAALLASILPVSRRAQGLQADSVMGRSLRPYALGAVQAPTLIISTRDDGYKTFEGAQYTADRIADSKFIGYESGGHLWVGHDDELRAEILKLLNSVH